MFTTKLRNTVIAGIALSSAGLATEIPSASSATPTAKVTVTDRGYNPASLKVTKGTKVTWKFASSRGHNVTVASGPTSFASPTRRSGTFSKTLTKTGRYVLYCSIHNFQMKIRVVK